MSDKKILRQLNKQPNNMLGQNFLQDQKVVETMLEAGKLSKEGTVVEIGPGTGTLTMALANRAKKVIAIERDITLAEVLRDKAPKNLTIVRGDALQVDWAVTIEGEYKIIASIPYSITSPLMRKILLLKKKPTRLVLLVQKEVAQRLLAQPGSRERGVLTLMREVQMEGEIIRIVPPDAFYPQPKVESAVIVLWPKVNQAEEVFWPAVEAGFRHKRQTLANGLRDLGLSRQTTEKMLEELALPAMIRPEKLNLEQWIGLSRLIKKEFAK